MSDPRYPIGKIELPGTLKPEARAAAIASIAGLPNQLYDAVRGLDQAQLDTPYRDGGWSLRQVVHHIGDSHVNAYVRHKLTITEPQIRRWQRAGFQHCADQHAPFRCGLGAVHLIRKHQCATANRDCGNTINKLTCG